MSLFNVIQLIGGVGIFLYSIKMISESLQLMAGNSLQNLIGMLTKTPVLGVMVGTVVTVLIQSSSATTVMTVSFVDAGLMTLKQAIGLIMGANIGTTVTGQIIAFKIKDYCYLFIILGSLLQFLGKTNAQKHLGAGLFGFGLLFIGMQTMEDSMYVLRSRTDLFLMFKESAMLGVLAGTVITVLIQSSAATLGITIALSMQGLIPLEAAIPIILGSNIGTTITTILAAIGTCRHAKQACLAHVLFNIIGVAIFLPIMPLYIDFIRASSDSIGHQIANAHSLFNICNTIIFLPFVGSFAKLITAIIPDPQNRNPASLTWTRNLSNLPLPSLLTLLKTNVSQWVPSFLNPLTRLKNCIFITKKSPVRNLRRLKIFWTSTMRKSGITHKPSCGIRFPTPNLSACTAT